jgi:hypothetical protein
MHGAASAAPAARASAGGFSLIDVLIANVVMAVSILVYVQCIGTESRLSHATEEKALAVVTLGRFVERMRADTSWSTLYTRLRPLSAESTNDPNLTHLGIDLKLRTWPVTSYYTDVSVPPALGTVTFLVQVPSTVVGGVAGLRETANAPRYGLPHDLNGDGKVDSNPRDADYLGLPVVVRLRWQHTGQPPHEVVLATLLRGER